ncbi:MAG: hypothetical protein IJ083_01785 [Clostridia bacterium]|nr:hypothetical protein [Clostridia bacterium]
MSHEYSGVMPGNAANVLDQAAEVNITSLWKRSAVATLWSHNEYFCEIFNKLLFRRDQIKPEDVSSATKTEIAWMRLSEDAGFELKNAGNLCKEANGADYHALLGLENMIDADPLYAFRVMLLDVLNYGRQIGAIEQEHAEAVVEKNPPPDEQEPPYLPGIEQLKSFRKGDKIKKAFTMGLYYGKDPWDGPTHLYGMMDSPHTADWGKDYPGGDYPSYIVDVRRIPEEILNQFSPELKAFLGFIKYEGEEDGKLGVFVSQNKEVFSSVPPIVMNALVEVTGSPVLEELMSMKEFATPDGGTNVCAGLEYLAGREDGKLT